MINLIGSPWFSGSIYACIIIMLDPYEFGSNYYKKGISKTINVYNKDVKFKITG